MSEWIKAFKGFNRDMSCTPYGGEKFQYSVLAEGWKSD